MAVPATTTSAVLDTALRMRDPRRAIALAEHGMLALRQAPPDMAGASAQALADATGGGPVPDAIARATQAIAAAVERHGAGFAPGAEPAYHDRHHQAETTRAMGWLAGAARAQGLLDPEEAALAVAAMAAHDLLHDGRVHAARGHLEQRSAEAAGAIAAAQGLSLAQVGRLRRIILATTWPWRDDEAPDLACRIAREADLFGSTLPRLGPRLSRLLAVELAAAGQPSPEGVASHAARVALLRLMPAPSAAARALGLDSARDAQLAAYAGVAQRLGIAEPGAEAGAAALDVMDATDAEALLAWSTPAP